jgi:hypothetical protein
MVPGLSLSDKPYLETLTDKRSRYQAKYRSKVRRGDLQDGDDSSQGCRGGGKGQAKRQLSLAGTPIEWTRCSVPR